MITSTVTLAFSDPAVDVLGRALKGNHTATYKGQRYWVVKATYRKRRLHQEDLITFKLTPAWFSH